MDSLQRDALKAAARNQLDSCGAPARGHCTRWDEANGQGPVLIMMSWLIMDGPRRGGFDAETAALRLRTLDLPARSGFYE